MSTRGLSLARTWVNLIKDCGGGDDLGKPVLLMGAGASIDAGLLDSKKLTRRIYEHLCTHRDDGPRTVFGYIIAKILARQARSGGSPFDEVNVEEAYDGVQKLVSRQNDLSSEFVASWDPFLATLVPKFNPNHFQSTLAKCFSLDDSRRFDRQPSIHLNHSAMQELASHIERSVSSSPFAGETYLLDYLIDALINCLRHNDSDLNYMQSIVKCVADQGGVVGTLNYDLVTESAMDREGIPYDYGLSSWSDKKLVLFRGKTKSVRLMKLHGSMNWFGDHNENILISEKKHPRIRPLLVFGTGAGKLDPNGPFLQLRHEFERALLNTNVFSIIGYSFGDDHLNSIIRRWVSTRRKAKLIIVNPNPIPWQSGAIGTPYTVKDGRLVAKTVDIVHITSGARDALPVYLAESMTPPDLKYSESAGLLPQILVRRLP